MSRTERPPATRTRKPRSAAPPHVSTDKKRGVAKTTKPAKNIPDNTPESYDDKEHTMSQTTTFTFMGSDADQWLDDAACAGLPIESFFVQAGHVIDEEVLNVCRGCPVRIDCLRHAYNPALNVTGGYFGGMSPGQRREMNYEQALEFCASDVIVTAPAPEAVSTDEPVIYS